MGRNNKVTLIGRVGKQPHLAGNKAFLAFSLATNETYPELDDKGNIKGYKATVTEWHNIIVFKDSVIEANQSLEKGALIKVRGSIQYRDAKDGSQAKETSIVASSISQDI
ncbi:MAG: single-stranded DNA-binding protein [Vicingaceae bacterium]